MYKSRDLKKKGSNNLGRGFLRRRDYILIIFTLSLSLIFFSCTKKERVFTDHELYDQAANYLDKEKFRDAEEVFKMLEEEYPESELMAKARISRADCLFQLKEYDKATQEYERFLSFHPLHPDAGLARFRIALSYYKQTLKIDRDQSYTIKALEAFERLLKEYPKSIFAQEAREKASECKSRLLKHDLYVIRFYLKTGSYKAARGRLQEIWNLYPEIVRKDEVLFLLYKTYMMEGMINEAEHILGNLCRDFPNTQYLKKLQDTCQEIRHKTLQ